MTEGDELNPSRPEDDAAGDASAAPDTPAEPAAPGEPSVGADVGAGDAVAMGKPEEPGKPPVDGGGGEGGGGEGGDATPPFGGRPSTVRDTLLVGAVLSIVVVITIIKAVEAASGSDDPAGAVVEPIKLGFGAFCTLVIFSFLYRENPIYRFFEHVLVGLGVGYAVGMAITNILIPNWVDQFSGQDGRPPEYLWLLALFPGLLWYFQLSKRYVWLSRLIIAFILGTSAGVTFKAMYNVLIRSDGRGQLVDTFRNVLNLADGNVSESINGLIFVIVVVCVLSYFFFSFRHERMPALKYGSRAGRLFLMISFGAIFGGAVMGRMALLISRFVFLVRQWLGL